MKLKLIKIFYDYDYSLYKLEIENKDLIDLIPFLYVDYKLYTNDLKDIYCLQEAPINELGSLLNNVKIEDILDHFSPQITLRNQKIIFQCPCYLIKGYFRFSSSGAPYLVYNEWSGKYSMNAIQSEACLLQIMVQGNRNNNSKYVNVIGSPIYTIKNELPSLIN